MSDTSSVKKTAADEKKENPLLSLILNIAIPAIILTKFSGEDYFGPVWGLVVALLFPFAYGVYDFISRKKINFISALGLISILLTGGIGLLELDPEWNAIKEAEVPLVIGLFVFGSAFSPFPLVRKFVYNESLINLDAVDNALTENGTRAAFDKTLIIANHLVAGSFMFSAVMNYVLAKMIVKSPPGSVAFNEELGRMTALSYPVIAIPSMIILVGVLYFTITRIKKLTNLDLKGILAEGLSE